ncbi:unnamed protein product [Parascedosporium putredinis]|uniref:Alpha-type protein kinase domain-containing protein n=1 Tax=Parascedosporium putredinis TaxID=1442378 RepID=A0A9P1H3B1_9PEZI|nr:unnamed protein product [Parascedosporium putredinis]CAI7996861.1 unnamed protein product [Parascedosporium putredinis]
MASDQYHDGLSRALVSRSEIEARLAEAMRRVDLGQPLDSASLSIQTLPDSYPTAGYALLPAYSSRTSTASTVVPAIRSSRPLAIAPPPPRASMAVAVVPPPRTPTAATASTVVPAIRSSRPLAIAPPPPRASMAVAVVPPPRTPTAAATSAIHPMEQRRLATIESRNLNRIDLRMQREGKASPSAAEAERRLNRLRSQASLAQNMAIARTPSAVGLFQNTCATDLLFLIDTTFSMDPYLEAAKNQVTSIVGDLSAAFFYKATLRVGVVSYKDHGDNPHIQSLDFTSKTDEVFAFLSSLYTRGGDNHDSYAEPGSEPHGLTHPSILQQMIRQNINYTLLRINHSTDRMAYVFYQAYAAYSPDCHLLESNKYAAEARGLSGSSKPGFQGWTAATQQAPRNVKFAELKLGTSYHSLRNLVVNFVTTSVTNSATFSSEAGTCLSSETNTGISSRLNSAFRSGFGRGGSHFSTGHTSISTVKASYPTDSLSISLETEPPQWDTPGWLNEEIKFAAYSTEVLAHGDSTLDRMMDSHDNIIIHTTNLTVSKRDKPFAKGAMRFASYARSGASRNELVVKTYIREGMTLLHLIEDMRAQALCKAFALEFNAMLPEQYSLDFIVVTCLEKASEAGKAGAQCMSLEPRIKGEYIKYNSNQGYVNESNPTDPIFQATQAFSHFTFERSGATSCVCELLGLLSNRSMVASGNYKFRETWPTQREVTNMLVCCSNKLCCRIVRMSKAKTSNDFPGYRWCYNCWPELESTTVKIVCTAPGRLHEFKLSRFFYESQGQILPRRCPKHREGDDAIDTPTTGASASGPDLTTCRFAAGCTNMTCPFLHPVPPCKTGATCEKSDCSSRHPVEDCRYKDKCSNSKCLFRHPGGHLARSGFASTSTTAVRGPLPDCRYGAGCTNKDCAFQHPVSICPRGADCTKDDCRYRHPKSRSSVEMAQTASSPSASTSTLPQVSDRNKLQTFVSFIRLPGHMHIPGTFTLFEPFDK